MDFNCRAIEESLYTSDAQVDDMLLLFLQEIDILFSTAKHTVYGDRDMGSIAESLLWSTSIDSASIRDQIIKDIKNNCYAHEHFIFDLSVDLYEGSTSQDIGVFTVSIKNNEGAIIAQPKFIFK